MMPPMVPMVLKIPKPVFTAGPCTSAGTLQARRAHTRLSRQTSYPDTQRHCARRALLLIQAII